MNINRFYTNFRKARKYAIDAITSEDASTRSENIILLDSVVDIIIEELNTIGSVDKYAFLKSLLEYTGDVEIKSIKEEKLIKSIEEEKLIKSIEEEGLYKVISIVGGGLERYWDRIYIGKNLSRFFHRLGETIFFQEDEKKNIYIRNKYNQNQHLLGKSIVRVTGKDLLFFIIPKKLLDKLGLSLKDQILLVANNDNIIMKDPFLTGQCAKDIIKKDGVAVRIFGISTISPNYETTIPKEIRDRLDNIDEFYIYKDKYSNIAFRTKITDEESLGRSKRFQNRFYLSSAVIMELDVTIGDEILWLLDENGDIYIKDIFLPITCFT